MQRLDIELVTRGIAKSRERAQKYIKSGGVYVNGKSVTKPAYDVDIGDSIEYLGKKEKFVGRGGLKLEKAINSFSLNLNGLTCVDLGASTGGFTDCMLLHGAKRVYAVDVGHGQLDEKLAADERVVNLEGINVKEVTQDTIGGETPDFVSADLSFISVKYAATAAAGLLAFGGKAVLLIKPQFEAGQKNISRGGIVKSKSVHMDVLSDIVNAVQKLGFSVKGLTSSPIKGGDGNIEYLIYLIKEDIVCSDFLDIKAIVEQGFTNNVKELRP